MAPIMVILYCYKVWGISVVDCTLITNPDRVASNEPVGGSMCVE